MTGSITDLVIKHEPVEEPQTVVIQVVRTDSDGKSTRVLVTCHLLYNIILYSS